MSQYAVKSFVERQWFVRQAGSAPHDWVMLPREQTGSVPIDEQINEWLEKLTGSFISVSPPGISHFWIDAEMTQKSVVIGVLVTYTRGPYVQATAAAPRPKGSAASTAGPAAG